MPIVKEVMMELMSHNIPIVGFVADNASVNKLLYDLLVVSYPFLINVPCNAHVLQLCIKKILTIETASIVCDWMKDMLHKFSSDIDNFQALRRAQLNDPARKTEPKQLLRPVDTRWSASLIAAERLYLLKNYISYVIKDVDSQRWVELNN